MRWLASLVIFICLMQTSFPQEKLSPLSAGTKIYLPGDLVHIVVGAPSNVVQIIAVLPDGQRIGLDFERRTHTWHGYWEIPYSFKKGSYRANLSATDVEGKTFEGETSPFYIGEPALVTLIGLESLKESGRRVERTSEAEVKEEEAEEEEIVAEKPSPVPKKEVKPVRIVKPRRRPRPISLVKARLITAARSYLATQEYQKTKSTLRALLIMEPKSGEIKTLLDRIDTIIKAREIKK